jgi:hypothetical protein
MTHRLANPYDRYHRYRKDVRDGARYDDGFADAEAGRTMRPAALPRHDEDYRLGYANGQRYSLDLDLVDPPPAVKRPQQKPRGHGPDRGIPR